MKSKLVKMVLVLVAVMLSGCGKSEESGARKFLDMTQEVKENVTTSNENLNSGSENQNTPNQNTENQNTPNQNTENKNTNSENESSEPESNQADEQSGISREFIEERYPGKIILNYMYAEPKVWNNQIERRYTDEQMVAVNDYLTENGQDYVINFMPVPLEEMSLDYVLEKMNGENPPDIITSVGFNEEVDNSTQKMVFNDVYQNLDEYSGTEAYEKLMNAYPSGLYELSLYNGIFYGFKTAVFENQVIYYLYNKDVADKYGISKSDIEGKSLSEIVAVLDKIKGWNDGNEESITASDMYMEWVNFVNVNIYFDNYEREPVFILESIGVDTTTDEDNVIAVTDSETIKKDYEALYEMYHKGYTCVNGIKDTDHYFNTSNIDMQKYNSFIESKFAVTAGDEIGTVITSFNQSQNMELAYGTKRCTTDFGGWSTINGVCKTSRNKEKALEAIAYICSDEMLSNIMVRGVESAGYEIKNYSPKGEKRYSSDGAGSLGNQYLVKTIGDIDRQLAAKSMEEAEVATEIEGYYFDLSDYKEEAELIKQIEEEYLGNYYEIPRLYSDEYETFEEAWSDFDKKLEEAGIDKILAEIYMQNKQLRNS